MSRSRTPNFAIAESGGSGAAQFETGEHFGVDERFTLSRYDLANSILAMSKVHQKKKALFYTPRDVFYLRLKNTSLLSDNKSLLSDNRSLVSDKKSLLSDNKSLTVDNKSLHVDNKSLTAENDRLRSYLLDGANYAHDDMSLLMDNKSLTTENKFLTMENKSRTTENDHLRSYMFDGTKYVRDNIRAIEATQTVSLHPCTCATTSERLKQPRRFPSPLHHVFVTSFSTLRNHAAFVTTQHS